MLELIDVCTEACDDNYDREELYRDGDTRIRLKYVRTSAWLNVYVERYRSESGGWHGIVFRRIREQSNDLSGQAFEKRVKELRKMALEYVEKLLSANFYER